MARELSPEETARLLAEMQATKAEQDAQREELYRGIGEYMYEYSRTMHWMRMVLQKRFVGDEDRGLFDLLFGEVTAYPFINSYFAICIQDAGLKGRALKVAKKLREQMLSESNRRNEIAHGDWRSAEWTPADRERRCPHVLLTKTSREDPYVEIAYGPDDFKKVTAGVIELRSLVVGFGEICLRVMGHTDQTVEDTFRIVGKGDDAYVVGGVASHYV